MDSLGVEAGFPGAGTAGGGDQRLTRVLSDFASLLVRDGQTGDAIRDLVQGVTDALMLAGAGMSLAEGEGLRFAGADDDRISAPERVQAETRSGPGFDAHRSGQPVLVGDLADHVTRWPAFGDSARGAGLVAVAGIPMTLGGTKMGVLDLYQDERRDWTGDEVRVATLLADMASGYVASSARFDKVRLTAQQLQSALDSRVIIEQAKGVLAGERNISVDAAFTLLRTHARSHNASLRSVAEAVVHLGLRP